MYPFGWRVLPQGGACAPPVVIVVAMPKTDVLDRVAADAARGHTGPAIRRLSSLVHAHPTDLDLRRRLAALYLRTGDLAEAGRWGYLDPAVDGPAVDAFERRYRWPRQRLRALRWPGGPDLAATGYARSRLADLVALAGSEPEPREAGDPVPAGDPEPGGARRDDPRGPAGGVGPGGRLEGPEHEGRYSGSAPTYDDGPPIPRPHTRRARLGWAAVFALACLVLLGLVVLGAMTVIGWFR
jgi:hypothetical protein